MRVIWIDVAATSIMAVAAVVIDNRRCRAQTAMQVLVVSSGKIPQHMTAVGILQYRYHD